MDKYEKVLKPWKQIVINNFIGGVAWAIGATIGFSLIVAIITIILKQINLIPFIGSFTAEITKYVLQSNPQLIK
ncbi:MAG: hypothetical protein HYT08_00170 [Candidatus Levybacteria bacterium]|nr:hypothetical protein [Candidatus Levybacteria bacterium]